MPDPDPTAILARFRAGAAAALSARFDFVRWIALATVSGLLAGAASYVFLESLDVVTEARVDVPRLVWALPLAGLVLGLVQHHLGGRATQGTGLLVEEIHEPTRWVPRRMAPLVYVGTVVSHLFGASVGREGTALQMSGSLTDLLSRILRLGPSDRRVLLIAAIAGGFGSVFGVPLAGAVFALEVQAAGRVRYEALVPALTASVVGDLVVGGLGHEHVLRPQLALDVDASLVLRAAVAGVVFGLVANVFTSAVHGIRHLQGRVIGWPPARLVVAGAVTVALASAVGRQYLGLSLPLIDDVLAGGVPDPGAFAWKLVFTAVVLGSGFPGGEVTPLFVIGTTLGGSLAGPLGVDVATLGALGFVGVFAGAANTPLACTIMGLELFGASAVVPMAVACIAAFVVSGHRGLYSPSRTVSVTHE